MAGAVVVAAMVIAAETARENADHHRRAQSLIEHLGARTQALSALKWQAFATAHDQAARRALLPTVLTQGMRLYRDIRWTLSDL